ncbi:MAG: tetratricopeptide repeat protein [Gemmatimonadales bacterium]|nr:tetratricopeptide repeat protein [Gemmatimonadales bacterium]
MPAPATPRSTRADAAAGALLAALVLAASATSLANGFAYDDSAAIVANARVHELRSPLAYLGESYWPPESSGSLYRPVTIVGFAVQWALGGGSALPFHVTSVLLKLAATLVAWRLLRRALGAGGGPWDAAWWGAAFFAVQPVHTEAVGNAVGQAELHALLGTTTAAWLYLRARVGGAPGPGVPLALVGCALWAALGKEQGILAPAFLALLEVTVVRDPTPWRARLRALMPTYAALALAMLGVVAARTAVLGGDLAGPVHWALRGLSWPERLWTMLAFVPTWLRLLFAPWHLRAEYNPPSFPPAHAFGMAQAAGLAALVGVKLAAWQLRRVAPAVTAGVGWIALALLPVSNVLVPTGILLADRTLLLPSVGGALVVAGALAAGWTSLARRPSLARALAGAGVALLAAFTWRSADRMRAWHDSGTLFRQMVADDPRSYKAHFHLGESLFATGQPAAAAEAMGRAYRLWDGDGRMLEDYGQVLQHEGRCAEALVPLRRALVLEADRLKARNRLYFCLLKTGGYDEAVRVAEAGVALGDTIFAGYARRADSLRRAASAP